MGDSCFQLALELGQPRYMTRSVHHSRWQGVRATQHDAWELGVTTSDCFGNADVDYPATLPAVRAALQRTTGALPSVPVVTGFLGRGRSTGALYLKSLCKYKVLQDSRYT